MFLYRQTAGERWPSGFEHRTGDRTVQGSNPASATLLRNFGNSVYRTLPVSFGGVTKSRRSFYLLSMAEEVKDPTRGRGVDMSWTPPFLEKDNSKIDPAYNTQNMSAHCT